MANLQIRGTTIDYDTDWPEFRKWLDGTLATLRYAWTDNSRAYEIVVIDGPVFRVAGVNKSDPPSPDQLDFETNFKPQTLAFEPRADNGGLLVSQSPYAQSSERTRFVGHLYTCAPGTSTHDERLTKPVKLNGGMYWARGASVGDRVTLAVVDVDNVTGRGPGTVLSRYVDRMPVAPWDHEREISSPTAGLLAAGLYLRLTYENLGAETVDLGVTYKWFET